MLRARSLIGESTAPAQTLAILYGIWASYYVGGEVAKQRGAAEDFLAEAKRHDDSAALCLAQRILGTTFITMGEFAAARAHLEQARALYDPRRDASVRFQYGQDIGAAALGYLSWALWHLGAVDEAARVADEAVTLAEASAHPHTLVYTLCHARGILDLCRRRTDGMRAYAGTVVAISTEHGFPFWAACGRVLDGWAAAGEGDAAQGIALMAEGLAAWRATGARLWLPTFLALQAQAHAKAGDREAALQAIEQAIAMAEETGERWALAEVLRLKATLLQAAGAGADKIEALLREGLQTARRQQARSWELRIACDLARLWRQHGRGGDARELLQPIYARFTEGFDTPDLRDAKALLAELVQKAK